MTENTDSKQIVAMLERLEERTTELTTLSGGLLNLISYLDIFDAAIKELLVGLKTKPK